MLEVGTAEPQKLTRAHTCNYTSNYTRPLTLLFILLNLWAAHTIFTFSLNFKNICIPVKFISQGLLKFKI